MTVAAAISQAHPLDSTYPGQRAVRCLFMRGGSSRGGVFYEGDMPADPRERAALLLGLYGSPDSRQIDGIGGSDPLTSKAAVVGLSQRDDADVEYTFYQVGIDSARVSTGGNCGNMLSAAAAFAVLRGLVPVEEPQTRLRIFTTNTGQVVTAVVPVSAGVPAVDGDCEIAGVPGSGGRILLDFGDCSGAVSGRLLPTGSPLDTITVEGRDVEVSLVDAATPFVFVAAADVGARGTELPEEILSDAALQARLEEVRGWAAEVLGLSPSAKEARAISPNVPRLILVSSPQDYTDTLGRRIAAGEHDVCVRQMAMQRPHRALAVTGSVCTAVASAVEGTVVARHATVRAGEDVRLGHPSGVLRVASRVERAAGGGYEVRSAQVERTARLIGAGTVFVPESRLRLLADVVEV
ncbi:2-methylaconitate cis-trans isomerase PrpF family protein [Afifella sp. IM 167]|uniref:2-methylaconitate cis-trans isomerase PrpF family protein n=1 Tax=Afifella sp. IM 167 TaxID=2033586 RepID=UPI001CCC3D28|nr:PrpF domain-containing protein [Afifella sp. IM 167]MBZ8132164.1 methylitaconate delta2-delta3-isomerase [Afifella sp. IM 167]